MPDLATHMAVGYLATAGRRNLSRPALTLFLFGNLLPDLATRPFFAFFPHYRWLFAPLHTPLCVVLMCMILARFLEPRLRRVGFGALLLGSLLHLIVDSLQTRCVDVYGTLFPFTWKDLYLPVFWPDSVLWIMPLVVAAALLLAAVRCWRERLGLRCR